MQKILLCLIQKRVFRMPECSEPIDPTKVNYQSLPSPPNMSISYYDPEFGETVYKAYEHSRLTDIWRGSMYGAEVAQTFKRGFTPSPVRRKYREDMEEALRREEGHSDTQTEDDVDECTGARIRPNHFFCLYRMGKR